MLSERTLEPARKQRLVVELSTMILAMFESLGYDIDPASAERWAQHLVLDASNPERRAERARLLELKKLLAELARDIRES